MNVVFMRQIPVVTVSAHEPRIEVHQDDNGECILAFHNMDQIIIYNRTNAIKLATTICDLIEHEV